MTYETILWIAGAGVPAFLTWCIGTTILLLNIKDKLQNTLDRLSDMKSVISDNTKAMNELVAIMRLLERKL